MPKRNPRPDSFVSINPLAKIDVAEAETKAEIIRAKGKLEITELEVRGLQRMVYEEGKNQANIEAITAKAIPHLSDTAEPQKLDEDFVRYLFDKAKLVSNDEMQELWAKILANEANTAGSFSRRSMDLVSQMSRRDAELFTRFVRNVWIIDTPTPVIPETHAFPAEDGLSLDFTALQHLESIGLVSYAGAASYCKFGFGKTARIYYYGCPVDIEFQNESNNQFQVGKALLTVTGVELANISGATPSIAAFERALEYLVDQNVAVSLPCSAKHAYLTLRNL
ncbi:DUF2806 domain-containing protein [Neorhizobium galegae]|uniref:DUF2806 domain-containing protein n=1 Tax=Neorhizobium galegae TaxID=399 RepID=A0A6A1TUE8_NEOGA|nr:DUF2806 domain-containing protein [Neorhizobium galegae]KAB1086527.1 DUF2806 domain-containing protein [Neorhizobium galegae]